MTTDPLALLQAALQERDAALDRAALLAEVLRWYGDLSNYRGVSLRALSPVERDRGARARETLGIAGRSGGESAASEIAQLRKDRDAWKAEAEARLRKWDAATVQHKREVSVLRRLAYEPEDKG